MSDFLLYKSVEMSSGNHPGPSATAVPADCVYLKAEKPAVTSLAEVWPGVQTVSQPDVEAALRCGGTSADTSVSSARWRQVKPTVSLSVLCVAADIKHSFALYTAAHLQPYKYPAVHNP